MKMLVSILYNLKMFALHIIIRFSYMFSATIYFFNDYYHIHSSHSHSFNSIIPHTLAPHTSSLLTLLSHLILQHSLHSSYSFQHTLLTPTLFIPTHSTHSHPLIYSSHPHIPQTILFIFPPFSHYIIIIAPPSSHLPTFLAALLFSPTLQSHHHIQPRSPVLLAASQSRYPRQLPVVLLTPPPIPPSPPSLLNQPHPQSTRK